MQRIKQFQNFEFNLIKSTKIIYLESVEIKELLCCWASLINKRKILSHKEIIGYNPIIHTYLENYVIGLQNGFWLL